MKRDTYSNKEKEMNKNRLLKSLYSFSFSQLSPVIFILKEFRIFLHNAEFLSYCTNDTCQ